jgi:hypothetical protein
VPSPAAQPAQTARGAHRLQAANGWGAAQKTPARGVASGLTIAWAALQVKKSAVPEWLRDELARKAAQAAKGRRASASDDDEQQPERASGAAPGALPCAASAGRRLAQAQLRSAHMPVFAALAPPRAAGPGLLPVAHGHVRPPPQCPPALAASCTPPCPSHRPQCPPLLQAATPAAGPTTPLPVPAHLPQHQPPGGAWWDPAATVRAGAGRLSALLRAQRLAWLRARLLPLPAQRQGAASHPVTRTPRYCTQPLASLDAC